MSLSFVRCFNQIFGKYFNERRRNTSGILLRVDRQFVTEISKEQSAFILKSPAGGQLVSKVER